MLIHRTEIEVVRGSVLEQSVDVIINAANTAMRGGGALDGAVHRAAGPQMLEELKRVAPNGAQTGEIVVTNGYGLPQRFVFHVAGPVWNSRRPANCDELLAQCYRHSLKSAAARELESIAFPSISTGVYAFPIERAAPVAVGEVVSWLREHPQTSLRRVIFAMFGGEEHHHFARAFKRAEELSEKQKREVSASD